MGSCIVFEEKKTHQRVLGVEVSWVKGVLNVLFVWNNKKNKGTSWTHDLINKKDSFNRENLVTLWV